jgi:nucleotide-binding universal stress UspA family protein
MYIKMMPNRQRYDLHHIYEYHFYGNFNLKANNMKKVLLAFDGQHFSKGVFEFVKQMNAHEPVMAIAIFLPSIDFVELLYSFGGVPAGPMYIPEVMQRDDKELNDNIKRFQNLCEADDIKYEVHTDFTKHIVTHIKDETRFADLLVLSSKSFYENLGEETQEDYLSNVMHKAECPVVLVPDNFRTPQNIIMAYDGSEQSVYAIKQFAYLLPEFRDTPTLLIYFETTRKEVPQRMDIENLVSLHFTHLTISRLRISPKKDLEKWIDDNGDTLLVAGAYGRSLFSEAFKRSFISEVIHYHKVPVFVAHK